MTKYSKFNIIYRLQKWLDSVPGQTFMNYAYSWGASIVILGTLFKLTHLPGANFKPDRGNYTEDGSLITSKCGGFSANSNGLYDMAGNVAEWTSTIYTEAGVDAMNDINPQLKYNAAKEDPYRLKKKSVRGGSWKDPESYIRSAWRSYEYQNQPRSYIGFRCVRSLANTISEKARPVKASAKKK